MDRRGTSGLSLAGARQGARVPVLGGGPNEGRFFGEPNHHGQAKGPLDPGGARGVDRFADEFARERGIEVLVIRPDRSLGKGAGLAANKEMARLADKLVAIHDGKSKGTAHMADWMRKLGKSVDYQRLDGTEA